MNDILDFNDLARHDTYEALDFLINEIERRLQIQEVLLFTRSNRIRFGIVAIKDLSEELKHTMKIRARGPNGKIKVLLQIDPHCHYCGVELDSFTATIDHKIPRSKGGKNNKGNRVLCCRRCNTLKGDMDYEEFIRIRRGGK
jgi:hypothetical protein